MLKNIFILILAISIVSCTDKTQNVDLIIYNANIYTVDSMFSKYEAMAISNGKITELGSNEQILKKYSSEHKNDLAGKTVFPGFIDAHCHFTGYATDLWKCNLVGTKSYAEIIERIKTYAQTAPLEWLYARGWDQNDWDKKEYPDNSELNRLFPNRPVFLKRIDGHAAIVNQKALDLAGISAQTKINGGSVLLKNGQPSGVLIDNAMQLVDKIVPAISDSMAAAYLKQTQAVCFSYGLTGVHDCGISEHTVKLLDKEQVAGNLKMKVFALLSDDSSYYDTWIKKGIYKTDKLHVGGFKIYGDGALGSRGASLLQDYSDQKNWKGFLLTDQTYLKRIATKLANSPFQMCTHAIGDSANRFVLDCYAAALKGKNNKRWRIEHAQVLDVSDFKKFGDYDIIPSVQPTHATSDMYWAGDRLGAERMKQAYAYKDLLSSYGKLALGTDFPVEDISPLKTFFAAVVRQDAKGFPAEGFQKENALSREETLRGMTIWAAYAAFEEMEKGSLEKGKAADFIVLDTDLMKCNTSEILNTKVLGTYLNGDLVYELK
ncbi:MAG: amidohydrolase [Bacteroidia bacterium]|nr:amidohydrolase [Bacteroidia bacterium]